jgi:hypothetical protein
MDYAAIYREARKTGTQADATRAVQKAGASFDQACDLCWILETGKPTPAWAHGDGRAVTRREEQERQAWELGHAGVLEDADNPGPRKTHAAICQYCGRETECACDVAPSKLNKWGEHADTCPECFAKVEGDDPEEADNPRPKTRYELWFNKDGKGESLGDYSSYVELSKEFPLVKKGFEVKANRKKVDISGGHYTATPYRYAYEIWWTSKSGKKDDALGSYDTTAEAKENLPRVKKEHAEFAKRNGFSVQGGRYAIEPFHVPVGDEERVLSCERCKRGMDQVEADDNFGYCAECAPQEGDATMRFDDMILLFEKSDTNCAGIASGDPEAIYNDFSNMGYVSTMALHDAGQIEKEHLIADGICAAWDQLRPILGAKPREWFAGKFSARQIVLAMLKEGWVPSGKAALIFTK